MSYVFIHIPKTGGLSIREALNMHPVHPHATATEVFRDDPGKKDWFSFAFVRNPWDRMLSMFLYERRRRQESWSSAAFRDFFDGPTSNAIFERRKPQSDYVFDEHGNQQVTFIGRFERLHEDFAYVCDRLGIVARLPHANRTDHGHYSDYYDRDTAAIVERAFVRDISQFGYRF